MIVRVSIEELYPIYEVNDAWGVPIEISPELKERIRRANEEFDNVQGILRELYEEVERRNRHGKRD